MNLGTLKLVFLFLVLCWVSILPLQNDFWQNFNEDELLSKTIVTKDFFSEVYTLYVLDLEFPQNILVDPIFTGLVPTLSGHTNTYDFYGIYPLIFNINAYNNLGLNDPTETMRFSISQFGLSTILISDATRQIVKDLSTNDCQNDSVYNITAVNSDPDRTRQLSINDAFNKQISQLNKI